MAAVSNKIFRPEKNTKFTKKLKKSLFLFFQTESNFRSIFFNVFNFPIIENIKLFHLFLVMEEGNTSYSHQSRSRTEIYPEIVHTDIPMKLLR